VVITDSIHCGRATIYLPPHQNQREWSGKSTHNCEDHGNTL